MHLWGEMAKIFPTQWQAYGEPVDADGNLTGTAKLWGEALAHYTTEAIHNAVCCVIASREVFPPNLPVFIRYCEPPPDTRNTLTRRIDEANRQRELDKRALPATTMSREERIDKMSDWRKSLRKHGI